MLKSKMTAFILLLLVPSMAIAQKDRASARALNSEGFDLYKTAHYKSALQKFQAAVKADESYALAHYNLACTLGILRKKHGPCEFDAYKSTIVAHLKRAVELDKRRAKRMRTDADLTPVHDTFGYQQLLGLSIHKRADIRKILVAVSWFGPSPGAFGPIRGINFKQDGTLTWWSFDPETMQRVNYAGSFAIKGTQITISLRKAYHGKKVLQGKLDKNGRLHFDEYTFSDDPDECSA